MPPRCTPVRHEAAPVLSCPVLPLTRLLPPPPPPSSTSSHLLLPPPPQVQPHAEAFGAACRLDSTHVANFGEEVVRGQPLFLVSLMLQKLEPQLRAAAGGAPWQVGRWEGVTWQGQLREW